MSLELAKQKKKDSTKRPKSKTLMMQDPQGELAYTWYAFGRNNDNAIS
jgi:hypothetical protein